MTATNRALGWNDVITKPREAPRAPVPTSWISDGQTAATRVLSAAAQCPTTDALALLETVPAEAWECSPELADLAKMLKAGIASGDPAPFAQTILEAVGYIAHPWALQEHCDALAKVWNETKPVIKPPDNGYEVVFNGDSVTVRGKSKAAPTQSEAPRAMLPEADLSNWEELAEAPRNSIFELGLVAGTMGLLVAPGGTGKSFLALQLALSVALGRALLPRFTPTRRGPVLVCFGEDDLAEVARRLKAICHAHHIPPGDVTAAWRDGRLSCILGKAEALLYFGHNGVATLTEAHAELERRCAAREYRFVVIDPVVAWAGVPNENDNSAMNAAAGSMISLAKKCGGAVLGIHHQSKGSSRGRETTVSTGRGATSMTDASRWQATLQMADAKKLGIPEVEATKFVELHIGKNSYFERDGRPLYLERVNGALVDAGLALPKSEDAIEKLARALANKIGGNPENMAKWNLLQEPAGAEFRREFKAENGKSATKENTVKAYALALERGWLVEECAEGEGGDNAKIPRIPAVEVVKCPD